ncbi:MAG: ABC transporter permease [Candidatus Dormibacteraceae bacterium]
MIEHRKLTQWFEEVGRGVRAELLKLDRRAATWILFGVAIAILALIPYLLNWLALSHQSAPSNPARAAQLIQLRHGLYPGGLIGKVSDTVDLTSALALILGVLMIGSEFSWGTFKTLFTQRLGRRSTLAAKLIALELALGVGMVLFFLTGGLCSGIIAALDQQPLNQWPSITDFATAILGGWLLWGFWGLVGVTLALAFRQSALSIGLGMAYGFVIEKILIGLAHSAGGGFLDKLTTALPGQNSTALAASFGTPLPGSPPPSISQTQAILVLLAYAAAALTASLFLISQREIK